MLAQKGVDRREDFLGLGTTESAVPAARNRQQLVFNPFIIQRLVQANGVLIRDTLVGVPMNRQDRRKPPVKPLASGS